MKGWIATLPIAAILLSACVVSSGQRVDREIEPRSKNIVIGAFNFSESQVLAEVYGQALDHAGFDADVLANVGPREIIEPSLEQEQIDIAIEYLGAALTFLDPDALVETRDQEETYDLLLDAFAPKGITPLEAAPGENRNEIVVAEETARKNGLDTISDLQRVDSDLTFGGPPECVTRPLCLEGLESRYQLEFKAFMPLDTGGPITVAALESGDVDVALLFTTNPAIQQGRLVALEDDRHLQPPENIVPVIRRELSDEHGAAFVDAIDEVSRLLSNQELRRLNAAVDIEHSTPEEAATEWLTEKGLL